MSKPDWFDPDAVNDFDRNGEEDPRWAPPPRPRGTRRRPAPPPDYDRW